MMPLSGDPPRSKVLTVALIVIVTLLALTPFLFPGSKPLNVAAKICIFIALAASYDLLLGYTGVVSFAHTMFYGIGSYGVAIALYSLGARWDAIGLGLVIALPLAALLALLIGLFSLRVQTIFFAMITLAVASAFAVLASQLSWLTGGEDGRSFRVPELLRPGTTFFNAFGVEVNGRTLTYYIVFVCCAALFLLLLRIVNSPFGRVLQAIRENPFRAEALGYRTVVHRTLANVIAAAVAAAVGALNAVLAPLHRTRHVAVLRHHAGHSADRGDRRHGHDVRRDHRRHAVHPRAELPSGADGRGLDGGGRGEHSDPAAAASIRTGGCSGSASCLFSRSYFFPTGIVGKLRGGPS